MVMMMMTIIIIKEAYLRDVAISNGHNFHSATDKLQMCTDLKEGFRRIWKMKRPVLYQ